MIKTEKEATIIINKNNEAVAIVRLDMQSRKTIFYSLQEMGLDAIAQLLDTEKTP